MRPRLLIILAVTLLAVAGLACSDDPDEPDATSPPGTTQAPSASQPPPPSATATTAPHVSCPVDTAYCDFAVTLLPILAAGDADALLALAEPVEATCPSSGLGGPSPSLCAGAAAGDKRSGYWDVQAGEGMIVPEADLRHTLDRWFASIQDATGRDARGPGELRIGAIACSRTLGATRGQCDGEQVDILFTFINAPQTPLERGTGIPGRRTTFFVRASSTDALQVNGFGTTVPPDAFLDSLVLSAVNNEGRPYTLESYPWSP